MTAALIVGLAGGALSEDERAFLADIRPAGVILFRRNVLDPSAIRALVDDVRAAVGDDLLILIDQEGGRVQRIKAPTARDLPPAAAFGALYDREPEAAVRAAFAVARLAAEDLRSFGITMNCAPVVDLPVDGAHDIIGDRAYGRDARKIVVLAQAVADGLMAGGVIPVIKHIPGHGRATADSHLDLPIVTTPHAELSRTDFLPFKALSHLPAAMTAHVVFTAIDRDRPASTSTKVTSEIIRGEIGFDGLLMSDDLSMQALTGPLRKRAADVLNAGSDIALHCNGDMREMLQIAPVAPPLIGRAARRFAQALELTRRRDEFDLAEADAILASLMAGASPIV